MLSDEEEAIEWLKRLVKINKRDNLDDTFAEILLNLIEKQSKEIEEYKKQLDLDNECEIALNNRIMDLEKEIEELKEKNKKCEYYEMVSDELYKNSISKDKIKEKVEEYKKQIKKMEKDDIGIGFTLGKEWSDLKAKVEFGQSLLEKE